MRIVRCVSLDVRGESTVPTGRMILWGSRRSISKIGVSLVVIFDLPVRPQAGDGPWIAPMWNVVLQRVLSGHTMGWVIRRIRRNQNSTPVFNAVTIESDGVVSDRSG